MSFRIHTETAIFRCKNDANSSTNQPNELRNCQHQKNQTKEHKVPHNPTSLGRFVGNVRRNTASRIQCYHKHAPEATCRLEKVQVREESAWTQKQASDCRIGIQHSPPCEQNIGIVVNDMGDGRLDTGCGFLWSKLERFEWGLEYLTYLTCAILNIFQSWGHE